MVESVAVSGSRSVRRQDREEFTSRLRGAILGPAARVGKYLVMPLEGGNVLVVHLRMSGRLVLGDPAQPRSRHTHAVIGLSDGRELRFIDPRTFGELFVSPAALAELAHLGPDPLGSWAEVSLRDALAGRRARLKSLLMDQRFLAGLGNIYSDEVLFEAGLRFDRPGATLTEVEVGRLHQAVVTTLAEAIEHRGSTLADAGYADLFGRPGGYQLRHQVYGREGQPCARCRRPVVRLRSGGRSSFLCEACQPA